MIVRQLKAKLDQENNYDDQDPATTTIWSVRLLGIARDFTRRYGVMTCDACILLGRYDLKDQGDKRFMGFPMKADHEIRHYNRAFR
jgi:hypothetical protein